MRRHAQRRDWLRIPSRAGRIGLAVLGLLQVGWIVRQTIAVRRLRAARGRAAGDASAKSMLLRMATHEIRTPLALARGYVDIVRSESLGPVNPEIAGALSSVERQLGQIDELVAQLVETSRLEGGSPALRLVRIDVREVVDEAVARVSEELGPKHELRVSLTREPAMVMAERFRLRTVLVNLLGNAIKYSPKGGEVRCTLHACRHGFQVVVADRGIGLKPADMQRLFEPFTRLPGGVEAAPRGLGLGLHLARSIAEAHGGRLTAVARPGGGSVFALWLPGSD